MKMKLYAYRTTNGNGLVHPWYVQDGRSETAIDEQLALNHQIRVSEFIEVDFPDLINDDEAEKNLIREIDAEIKRLSDIHYNEIAELTQRKVRLLEAHQIKKYAKEGAEDCMKGIPARCENEHYQRGYSDEYAKQEQAAALGDWL